MGMWKTWHHLEREDGSACLYYTLPGQSTYFVVYDTTDGPLKEIASGYKRRAEAAESDAEHLRKYVVELEAALTGTNQNLDSLCEQVAALTANRNEWQPADHAPFGQTVLAHYLNRLGKTRIVRATRVAKHTLLDEYDDDDADYDDITCEYYRPSGWYERLENGDYDYFGIDGIVTHYMPLPSIPEVHDGTPNT